MIKPTKRRLPRADEAMKEEPTRDEIIAAVNEFASWIYGSGFPKSLNIEQRLKRLLEAYDEARGDRELAIFYYDQQWNLEIGNPNNLVALGEVCGDYCYTASMLEECIEMAEEELLND